MTRVLPVPDKRDPQRPARPEKEKHKATNKSPPAPVAYPAKPLPPAPETVVISTKTSGHILAEYPQPTDKRPSRRPDPERKRHTDHDSDKIVHPFPRPRPQPVRELALLDEEPYGIPDSVSWGRNKKVDLIPVETFAIAKYKCYCAWHNRLETVAHASAKLIAASRMLRQNLLSEPGLMVSWIATSAKLCSDNAGSFEGLLESHCSKTQTDMSDEARERFWIFGAYLAARIQDCNEQLVKVIGLNFELDEQSIKKNIGHFHPRDFEKAGFFSRLVEQTLAQFPGTSKDARARRNVKKDPNAKGERTVPDVTQYPTVGPGAKKPAPPTPAPEYFDECDDEALTNLNLNLRAASIAFYLAFANHESLDSAPPNPAPGRDIWGRGPIYEASIPNLVRYLTDHFESRDEEIVTLKDAFFRFFRYLVAPARLLELLTDRYREKPPQGLLPADCRLWRQHHVFTKLFIVRMIATWLENYYIHSHDKCILDTINKFCRQRVAKDEDLPPSAAKLITLQLLECDAGRRGITYMPALERTIAEGKTRIKEYPETGFELHVVTLRRMRVDRMINYADILIFHNQGGPEELARTLTRVAAIRFQNRTPTDIIAWDSRSEDTWLDMGYEYGNALALWASHNVLEQELPANRAKAYEIMSEVAWICHNMRNFSSAFCIAVALGNQRIERMTQTRELVSEKHKAYIRRLERFYRKEDNRAYMEEMRRPPAPTVPNPVFVREQLRLLTGGKTFFETILVARDERSPIDFYYLSELGRIVTDVERGFVPYEVPVHKAVLEWVQMRLEPLERCNIAELTANLDKLSLVREPDRARRF